ncbi:hypothetical protein CDL62_01400 [Alkalitalea saponilacus]|nr:hypothetical protein CDL62_01400 [Alkalitalea saponilacus]
MAVANSHASYTPPQRLKRFEEDLESIMLWLGRSDDVLLTRNGLSADFASWLSDFGFDLPKCVVADSLHESIVLDELHPWGWSPAMHKYFSSKDLQTQKLWHANPMSQWHHGYRQMLSRLTGFKLIRETAEILKNEAIPTISIPEIPLIVETPQQIDDIERKGTLPRLLKTPWSASGRGLFKIRDNNEQANKNPWVLGKLKQQGFLLVEPFLNKLQDVSFHFWCDSEGIRFLGTTYFSTDSTGQFLGCFTHLPENINIPESLLKEGERQAEFVLLAALEKMKINTRYHGPLGVDGLFFLNTEGGIFLNPCIEVNLRYSMGLVNLKIREQMAPGRSGKWQIGCLKAQEWIKISDKNPVKVSNGRIHEGVMPLTVPPEKEGHMAWLEVIH